LLLEERDRDELLEEGFASRSAMLGFAEAFFLGAFRRAARAFDAFLGAFFGDLARFFFFFISPPCPVAPDYVMPDRTRKRFG